jgi:hypothetical protein
LLDHGSAKFRPRFDQGSAKFLGSTTALHSQERLCHRLSRREPELYDFRAPFAARMASLRIVAKVNAEGRATVRFFRLVRSIFHAMAHQEKILHQFYRNIALVFRKATP